jgi:hypothetical protein
VLPGVEVGPDFSSIETRPDAKPNHSPFAREAWLNRP